MTKKDYYEILEVEKSASNQEIRKAYKNLAKKYHPDINKDKGSSEKFKEISEAYAVLSDPQKKAQYDKFGHNAFNQYSQEDIFSGTNFGDILRDIFGDSGFFGENIFDSFFGHRARGARTRKANDIQTTITISLNEADWGIEKEISIQRHEICNECEGSGGKRATCNDCKGQGHVRITHRTPFGAVSQVGTCPSCRGEGNTITVTCRECNGRGTTLKNKSIRLKVPAGISRGMAIHLRGEGNRIRGGLNGDVIVEVDVEDYLDFIREGENLFLKRKIPFPTAVLGGEITVPTLEGEAILKIPPATESHTTLRMKGLGVTRLYSKRKGDLFVKIIIDVPAKLSSQQKEALELFQGVKRAKKKRTLFG